MTGRKTMKLASRGRRFAAACIDMVIPFIAYIVFSVVVSIGLASRLSPGYGYGYGDDFGYGYGFDYGYGYGSGSPLLSRGAVAVVVITILLMIAFAVVQCIFFSKGRSIGKMILGLQVVSSTDGTPFRFWKMMLREIIVKQASAVLLLGYIWILIDDKNRGWHDKILDSYVVDLKESERLAQNMAPARAEEPVYSDGSYAEPITGAAPAEPAVTPVSEDSAPIAADTAAADSPASEMPKKPVIRLDD